MPKSFLSIFAALALVACATPQVPRTIVIPLDLSGPRPGVQVTANGAGPLPAIFDTGATTTVVNPAFAEQLSVTNDGPLLPPWDRHSSSGYQTLMRNVAISGVPLGDISAPVVPSPLPDRAVVFSPIVFAPNLVVLDLAAAELRVVPKTPATLPDGPGTPYASVPMQLPVLPITIGGERIEAHLDTGSPGGLMFPMSYAERLPLAGPLTERGAAATHARRSALFVGQIRGAVQVGPLTLIDPPVMFSDAIPGPNVGMTLLRQMTITLDPQERLSWVRANN